MNRLASLLSILGLCAATYLSRLYYSMHTGTAGFKSLCNVNATFNCDLVTSTKYAELFPGLPLSSVVAGWFFALFLVSIAAAIDDWKKDAIRVGFVMSLIGSVYGIALLFVMAFVLKTLCLFCLVVDLANFGLLFVFWKQIPKPILQNLGIKKWGSYTILTAVSVFFATILIQSSNPTDVSMTPEEETYTVNQILGRAPETLTLPEGVSYLGNPNGKITLIEASDFQCPFCQKGAFLVNSLMALYPNDLRVAFLNYPLDSSCHRQITRPMHPFACQLARGSVCAEKRGKFKEYYEDVFENQASLNGDSARKGLEQIGLSTEDAKACLDGEEAKKIVSTQIEFGIANKVESTPTFFINGRKIEGAQPLSVWKALIEKELAAK